MPSSQRHILIVQTGGTIAMADDRDATVGFAEPGRGLHLRNDMPELGRIASYDVRTLFVEDSSNLNPRHWENISSFIAEHYDAYDGFVVVHGTDTMAYTASYLSFALQNLAKPVILTGSQIPLGNVRSDARRNLINAVEMASNDFNEVAICFNDKVLRGNRSTKMSIGDFDAFASPNLPPLGEIGLRVHLRLPPTVPTAPFRLVGGWDDRLALVKFYPGMRPAYYDGLADSGARALVVEAFGAGNIPVSGPYDGLALVQRCLDRGMVAVVTSQAPYDAVDLSKYENSRRLLDIGVLSAGDMTFEATVTKLMHLLGRYEDVATVKKQFMANLAGERSF